MKFASLKNGTTVIVTETGIISLAEGGFPGDLKSFIELNIEARDAVIAKAIQKKPITTPPSSEFDAPLRSPGKLIAIGLNYVDHAAESKMTLPENPLIFTKFNSSITGPNDPIFIPTELTQQVDYEVEFGVVIGKKAKNVSLDEALDYVFGYTIINDVSARDLQFADKQWVRGKSLDTFCPMGPVIVTADEMKNPQDVEIGCEVNGQVLQQANTRDMIFGVAVLVSELSKSFTLHPGDVIASGTPSGVGFSHVPPIYLKPGDKMRTWVDGIGELNNTIHKA
jgi:2-keto-4-pentenoate hydratase/2-oxohepta-3-ene-1,7-dioic acid hydratase in catechol pathway